MSIAKETSESLFETFVRFRDPSEDTTEGSIIELLPLLPGTDHDCLATFQDDKHGDTFLHYACRNGWYEVTKVLIEKYKCDPNCRNKNGSTPLLFAYTSGNQNLVDYLIVQSHCDPLAIDRDGLTRLHYAILGGQLAMVKHLIEEEHCDSGCKTNDSQTPLHLACLYGWLDMVKYLIEKQHCDTCCTTNCSGTPMYFACAGGHLDILRYLIEEQGCDPNCSQNNYILHLACAGGYMHIVTYLIEEQHCNVDCRLADDGSSLLHLASTKGHLNVLKYLIEIKGCDPNCVENTGMTPLHIACKYGWLDITKYLIEDQHCDPNCTNKKNWTPLHLACYNRHMDVVIYFVEERHCDTDCKTSDGRTVLHLVCETGHLEIVNYVIEQQLCDPNCTTNDGWTPMHFASREGKIDLIRYFTNTLNCDSNCKDSNGWTPLHLACFSGDKDIVKYLIEKQHCELDCKTYGLTLVRFISGTNINKYLKFCLHHMSRKGWMPLHLACYSGNTDIVRHLIEEQHCDLDCRTDDGITPVHIACQYGRLDVAKYLTEEQHCDPNCTTNDGWTPIHFASQEGRIDIVRYFVKSLKFNWNFKNNKGWTPLHLACYHANVDIVKCLLEAQCCNSECRTNDGKGPLYLASEKGYLNVVKYLVEEYHCDTNCKDNYTGMTALHAACFNGSLDVAKYLIEEQHCDPNCKQNTDMTPLHLACVKGHLDVVKYLIEEQHCDPNCKQNTGMTLLHIVCRYGSLDVLKYLIEEQHCGPNSKENTGMTPLHIAYKYGHLDVAKHLIEEWHCDPNCTTKDGWTPMHFVSQDGRIDDVKYLAEQLNCDSNCKDSKGWTPLHLACYNENMDIIKYLVEEQHCDLDGRTYDWTNLIGEHFSDRFKYYELWSEFMNGKDWAPLHLVCYSGNMDIIKYLTEEKKCDLYCRTNDGITPLHLVCFYGHLKVVKYLVERHKCDLLCKNIYGQTPLHYNCRCKVEALDLFQYLVESKCYDVTSKDKSGRTPLHYAAERGHLNICKILAEKHNCSPLATSLLVPCPLQISVNRCKALTFLLLLKNCIRTHEPLSAHNANILSMTTISAMLTNILDHYQCEIASLLITLNGVQLSVSPFIHVVPHQLVQPAIKVFVVGNSLSGKTTLIEALKTGTILKRTLSGLFSWKRKVLQVQSSTAGIIPVHMQADDIGHIIMYDFAGHHEYYSSHAALMDTLAFSKGTMIIILLNLREDISKLVKTLEYWQSFIRNATYTKSKGPPVLVMGSHSDVVVSEGEDPSERLSLVLKKLKHPLCNVGVDLNCTLLSSEGLNKLKNVIKKYAKYSFEKYDMDLPKVNFLNIFVIKKHLSKCTACLVSSMMAMIKRREEFSILRECGLIPLTIDELSQTLTTLSECGQLLYLKNSQDVMKGWIILQPSFLLSQINGTIFSSSNRTISSETGIVHLSKIKELFRYRHQMIINLMTHLEFCHRISDSEVLLVNKCLYSSVDSDASEVYYFFPALVEQERPIATWESMSNTHYRCGWCLRRRDRIQDQFLSPRFIHVLLLRLAILFGQNPDEGYKLQ